MKKIILDFSKPISDIVLTEDSNIFGLFQDDDNGKTSEITNLPTVTFTKSNLVLNIIIKAVIQNKFATSFEFSPTLKVNSNQIGTIANIKIDILNLSKESIIKSTPSMEICEPDISASHSFSVSSLDETQLNYLLSRGLSEDQARELLINSFIADIMKEANNIS